MHALIERDSDRARDVVLAVAKSLEPDEWLALSNLGASALEDLLKSAPERYFEDLEGEAMADERVAVAMGGVWLRQPWEDRLIALRAQTGLPPGGY
jgi:hypothetical protein